MAARKPAKAPEKPGVEEEIEEALGEAPEEKPAPKRRPAAPKPSPERQAEVEEALAEAGAAPAPKKAAKTAKALATKPAPPRPAEKPKTVAPKPAEKPAAAPRAEAPRPPADVIETKIDQLCKALETAPRNELSLEELGKRVGADARSVEKVGRVLQERGVAELIYPVSVFAKPSLRLLQPQKAAGREELKGERLLEGYDLSADGVPAQVKIWQVSGEPRPVYDIRIAQPGPYTALFLESLRDRLAREVPILTEEITDPKKLVLLKTRFHDASRAAIEADLPELEPKGKEILSGMLLHRMYGLGVLELLMVDDKLEEVAVNSSAVPISVYHKRIGWMKTTLRLETEEEIYNYAAQIGRKAGREISLLNPILDAPLLSGDRVTSTLFPISSFGNTITIRRFAREPWTMAAFMDPAIKSISLEMAAFLWLAVQYELNVIFAGGTATGKTSALNAASMFIPSANRIVTVEESVTGEAELLVEEAGSVRRTTIGELVDARLKHNREVLGDGAERALNDGSVRVLSMTPEGRIVWAEPFSFLRHRVKRRVREIVLRSGRRITITPDHSLFTLDEEARITPVLGSSLKPGSFVATPRRLPLQSEGVRFDLTRHLRLFTDCMVEGEPVRRALRENAREVRALCKKPTLEHYRRAGRLPVRIFSLLRELVCPTEESKRETRLVLKRHRSGRRVRLPLLIEVDEDLACLAGLWLADGCYDDRSVLISGGDETDGVVRRVAKRFGLGIDTHRDGITLRVHSRLFKRLFEEVLGLRGDAFTKRVPNWAFNLNEAQTSALLRGYFSGDGAVKRDEVAVLSACRGLLQDMQTLLLRFEIPLQIPRKPNGRGHWEARISNAKFVRAFAKRIGMLQKFKQDRLNGFGERKLTSTTDVVPLPGRLYLPLKHHAGSLMRERLTPKSWKSWHRTYASGGAHVSRSLLSLLLFNDKPTAELAEARERSLDDLYWDRVEEVRELDFEGFVYDLSVPGCESFVVNNIVAHNTREIQLPSFLRWNWVPFVTRGANPEGKGEVTMLDLMVASLRMRPDRILVGEVRRSAEAEVLFEAMHTGHAVYSTLHADNAQQAVRRLTNEPIKIPPTELETLQLFVVQYRDRRTGIRRTSEITELVPGVAGEVNLNPIYRWRARTDTFEKVGESVRVVNELSTHTGMTLDEIHNDLASKERILEWMVKQGIKGAEPVGSIMNVYYRDPSIIEAAAAKNLSPDKVL